MSGSESASEDRTELPTQIRMQQARDAGQVPISRDLTMFASVSAGLAGCVFLAPEYGRRLAVQSGNLLGSLDAIHIGDAGIFGSDVSQVIVSGAMVIAAVAIPAIAAACASTLLQSQFHIGSSPVHWNPGRLNPITGFSQIVSIKNGVTFLKTLARLAIACVIAWIVLRQAPGELLSTLDADLSQLMPETARQILALAKPLLIALGLLGVADVFLVRFQHTRSIRMTREQVRLERRDTDGDPHVKGKLRRMRIQRSRRRMMAKVKTADVIVTNPTHYAVALSYERGGNSAPRVVAKGVDEIAARIREEAGKHKVPIVASPPLARALFLVDLDLEIPAEHYRAVAEVIAYVWRHKSGSGSAPITGVRPPHMRG
jgi:flagellar biosynthetic protein FlhB